MPVRCTTQCDQLTMPPPMTSNDKANGKDPRRTQAQSLQDHHRRSRPSLSPPKPKTSSTSSSTSNPAPRHAKIGPQQRIQPKARIQKKGKQRKTR